MEDETLKGYVEDLAHAQDMLGLTQWEQDFIFQCQRQTTYSSRQKEVILNLAEKYAI